MARPRKINPRGKVAKLSVIVSEPVALDIRREAKRRGVTVGEVMRDRLGKAS
jgi:hypothetical protein